MNIKASKRSAQSAFTLVEMLLVLVIIGTLAAIVVPKLAGRTEESRITAVKAQISSFGTALDVFETDNGYYPRGSEGLNELLVAPSDAQNWKGPYLKTEIPVDPWGHPYIYEYPGKNNPNGYDLSSGGPDGRPGTEDDITSWSTGAKK
jgi:general secretion pathway protein G